MGLDFWCKFSLAPEFFFFFSVILGQPLGYYFPRPCKLFWEDQLQSRLHQAMTTDVQINQSTTVTSEMGTSFYYFHIELQILERETKRTEKKREEIKNKNTGS
jgi:hypothetical protein